MTCGSCGSANTQVSGKCGGYFGCLSARNSSCTNSIKVPRKLTENLILKEDSKQISSPEIFRRILNEVEKEVAKTYSDVPNLIRQKKHELSSEKRRIANFVEFIAEGRGNQTVGKALQESENKAKILEMEIDGLRRSCNKVFQSPPIEWVKERLSQIQQLLE